MLNMSNWHNKVLVITGASRGIGLAVLEKALKAGAKVSVLSRSLSQSLEQFKFNTNVYVHQGDVSQEASVKAWVEETINKFKQIDVVVNNAGLMYYMDIRKADYQQMKKMIEVNCFGFINLVQHVLPTLSNSRTPHWINITSDAGKQPFPGLAIYSGTKAFVEFSARAMRQELMEANVKITNIQPGNVDTSLHQLSTDADAVGQFGTQNQGQYLNPQDIADAVDYAVSTPHQVAVNEILIEPLVESIS